MCVAPSCIICADCVARRRVCGKWMCERRRRSQLSFLRGRASLVVVRGAACWLPETRSYPLPNVEKDGCPYRKTDAYRLAARVTVGFSLTQPYLLFFGRTNFKAVCVG